MSNAPRIFREAVQRTSTKSEFREAEERLRTDLLDVQYELREAGVGVLLMLTGDDRVGTQEVLGRLSQWLDPRWIDVHVGRRISAGETLRPPQWRFWRRVPARGRVTVYLGGWAGAVIRARAEGGRKRRWRRNIEHVRSFEAQQAADGAGVLKLWLHLPASEHKRRLKQAEKHPDAQPLVETVDELLSDRLDDLLELGAEFIEKTTAVHAPWIVIDGSDRLGRDLAVGEALLEAARRRLANGPHPREVTVLPPLAEPLPLAQVDLTARLDKDEADERIRDSQAALARLSRQARDAQRTCVFAFEGWDAAGKGGAIRRLTAAMSAMDYRVIPVAAPSEEEKAHHWLWRFWRHMPEGGRQILFDRSWYGRVLVERVEGFAEPVDWQAAYREICDFEEQIVEHGWSVAKFWLHISDAEQLARFEARADTPYKRYKLTDEDWRNRSRRPAYEEAVNEMIARTHAEHAPWHVISAEDKRHARVAVLEAAVEAMNRALD